MERVFQDIVGLVYVLRMKEMRGLEIWSLIRPILENIKGKSKWKQSPEFNELIKNSIPNFNEDQQHYLKKLINIPLEKECSFLRVMQIALNISQIMFEYNQGIMLISQDLSYVIFKRIMLSCWIYSSDNFKFDQEEFLEELRNVIPK